MKRRTFITIAALSLVAITGLIGTPWLNDRLREHRYWERRREMKEFPKVYEPALSEREEEGWVEAIARLGVPRLSEVAKPGNTEVYRILFGDRLNSGAITIVLGTEPYWEEITYPGTQKRRGALSQASASKVRSIVERCRFWKIDDYGIIGYVEGDRWYFEGVRDGRYRMLVDFRPDPGLAGDLCRMVAAVTDSGLARDQK